MSREQAFTRAELVTLEPLYAERRIVRFQDVDAAGIIFYPRVLEYFSDAYVGLLLGRGYDLPGTLDRGEVGAPLVHAEADYLAPLRFGEPVEVSVVEARLGTTSFRLGHRMRRPTGEACAVGQTVHVCIDRRSFEPRPIPDELRRVFQRA